MDPASDPGGVMLVGVSRRFGETLALAPLSLHVTSGSVCAITGANGSGKTTLLRLAAGLLAPTTGERRATGLAVYFRAGGGARRHQRVEDAVRTAARLAGAAATTVTDALLAADLRGLARRRVGELSSGQRARLTLTLALAVAPEVVCLDEPTGHLDAAGCAVAARIVDFLATDSGSAVLVATHDVAGLGGVDHVLELAAGRVANR